MNINSKIYVAGHTGMVGSAIVRELINNGYKNIILQTREELDLLNIKAVENFFIKNSPDYVIIAAAKVGGINANNIYRAEFLYENLMIQNNLIHFSHKSNVKKLLFLGSSCIYPKECEQPMKEEYLLTGLLEKTNEPYAIAKIAGIKMCESYYNQYDSNFFSIMPTNLYGPNDNYHLDNSHVLPALIRKIHEAKINNFEKVMIWGSGIALRDFMHVDDLAEAVLFVMGLDYNKLYDRGLTHLNAGTGVEVSIGDLVKIIAKKLNFKGKIEYDSSKPDGTPRKIMDSSRLASLGWQASISLEDGIDLTYKSFLEEYKNKWMKNNVR